MRWWRDRIADAYFAVNRVYHTFVDESLAGRAGIGPLMKVSIGIGLITFTATGGGIVAGIVVGAVGLVALRTIDLVNNPPSRKETVDPKVRNAEFENRVKEQTLHRDFARSADGKTFDQRLQACAGYYVRCNQAAAKMEIQDAGDELWRLTSEPGFAAVRDALEKAAGSDVVELLQQRLVLRPARGIPRATPDDRKAVVFLRDVMKDPSETVEYDPSTEVRDAAAAGLAVVLFGTDKPSVFRRRVAELNVGVMGSAGTIINLAKTCATVITEEGRVASKSGLER